MQNRSLQLLLVFACFGILSGCGPRGPKQNSTQNRIVEFELSDVDKLNPLNSTDANATYIQDQIFDHLISPDPKALTYTVPLLADSMPTESADHLQFDFSLRKDVKWADGTPFTGNDVIFSLKALKNPFNVQSGQKRVYVDPIHSVELINGDPYHVRFKLWKPYFLIRQATFGDALYIMPKHIFDPQNLTDKYNWDDIGAIVEIQGGKEIDSATLSRHKNPSMQQFADWFSSSELNRSPKYILGTGAYKLDEWKTQSYIRLVRNPYYVNHWGQYGEAFPDTLLYKTVTDFSAAVTSLKSREIDLLGSLQPQFWVSIDTNKNGLKRQAYPLGAYAYIGFNQRNPIFADKNVRLAMAYFIDRKLIINKLMYGLAQLTESPTSATHPEVNKDLAIIPFDPVRGQQILDSLDWKDHDGDGVRDKMIGGKRVPFKFTFTVNSGNETRKKILLIFSEALRKVGIQADVSSLEWSVFIDRLRDHQIDAHYGSWITDPYEADQYQLFHSSQAHNRGSNYDSYNSPEADRLMEQIRSEFDESKRIVLQKQLQKVLYDDQANLFLWEPLSCAAWVDRFDNVQFWPYRPGYDISTWKVRGVGPTAKASMNN